MNKTYVLRGSALLSSVNATLRFGDDNIIVIPMPVLDEVNKKNLSPEKSKIRRELFEYLRSFDFELLSSTGVKQANGSILKVIKNHQDESIGIWENNETLSSFQKRTLKVCLALKKRNENVVLVTNNPYLQMIAEDCKVKAENFKDETFPRLKEQYTGRITVNVSKEIIDQLYEHDFIETGMICELNKKNIYENEYVLLQYEKIMNNGQKKMVKAYGKIEKEKIHVIRMHERKPYGIKAMNDGQRFLINSLYDDAPATVVKGNAGTGKTFCTLAVALDQIENNKFSRILVTRKADFSSIGYLPGELENKMSPYLAGFKDNLSVLLNGTSATKKNNFESGEYFFEKGYIQIQALELLRGRSIVDTLFIIDETQNIEPDLIKTIITRAGKGSKFVFLGDPTQVDNPTLTERYNGLVYLSEKLKGSKFCTQVSLMDDESVRSELARYAAKIF